MNAFKLVLVLTIVLLSLKFSLCANVFNIKRDVFSNSSSSERVGKKLDSSDDNIALKIGLIKVHYGQASQIADILKKDNRKNGLLSKRGSVSFDKRTNTLIVFDTKNRVEEIKKLVKAIDRPIQQVMIEARIVVINRNFEKELGVRFGLSGGNSSLAVAGNLNGAHQIIQSNASAIKIMDRLNVNAPISSSTTGQFALAVAKLPAGLLLDLELQALESEGEAEVISTPRLLTADDKEAFIEQGEEIPYLQNAGNGATSISFKKAVLGLTITPHITPKQKIVLEVRLSKDSRGLLVTAAGANTLPPAIDTRVIKTQALIDNGQTLVLGGIYEQGKHHVVRRVPFLADIPGLGHLFRSESEQTVHKELMIFVTPKIAPL